MSKTLSTKYYQENKEWLQKNGCERHQNLSKEEKEKKHQYGCKRCKNLSQKMKNKIWLSIEKNIIECEKNSLL